MRENSPNQICLCNAMENADIRHGSHIFFIMMAFGYQGGSVVCLPQARGAFHAGVPGLLSYTLCTYQVKEKCLEMKNRSPSPAYRVDGKSGKSFFVNKIFSRQRKKKRNRLQLFPLSQRGHVVLSLRKPRDPKSIQSLY